MNLVGQASKNENKMQILEDLKFQPSLEEKSGCLSKSLFTYTNELLKLGSNLKDKGEYLQDKDMFDCKKKVHPKETQKLIQKKFSDHHQKLKNQSKEEQANQKGLFSDIMTSIVGNLHWKASVFLVIAALLQFAGPLCLKLILDYLEDDNEDDYKGYVYSSIILVCFVLRTFLMQKGMYIISDLMVVTQNGFAGSMVEKILKLSSGAKKYFDAGKIMNFVTVDQQMVFFMAMLSSQLFSAPVTVVVSMVLICLELGWWGLLTPLFFFISLAVQGIFNGKDSRAKAVYEYFSGIRIIKYYAWEEVVENKINEIRKDESAYVMKNSYIRTLIEALSNITPLLISTLVIIIYVASGNSLSPSKTYSVIALFNLIMHPFKMMMFSLIVVFQTKASLKRMDHFMLAEERKYTALVNNSQLTQGTIQITDGTFAWETMESFKHHYNKQQEELKLKRLQPQKLQEEMKKLDQEEQEMLKKDLSIIKNINFQAKQGQMVAIIGTVAAGKTTLLHALLGELYKINGDVQKNGSMAYVSQTAWMQNATIRDNILFGNTYDKKKFEETIKICELTSDLEILPGGEQSEIGERGINLSGGQKQRLAIARAVYADADIYIIDDCLSALDAHVGKNIFNNVFKEKLKNKTIIFVTHALQYLPQMNRICIMKNGEIIEQGSYDEVSQNQKGEFQKLVVQMKKQEKQDQENLEKEKEDISIFDAEDDTQSCYIEDFNDEFGIPNETLKEERFINVQKGFNFPQLDLKQYEINRSQLQEIKHKAKILDSKQKQKQIQQQNLSEMSQSQKSKDQKIVSQQDMLASETSVSTDRQLKTNEFNKKKQMQMLKEGAMTLKEERAVGTVSWQVYKNYMQSGGRGTLFLVVMSLIISQVSRMYSDWWIGAWSEETYDLSTSTYAIIYGVSGLLVGFFFIFRGIIFAQFSLQCADNYQKKITKTLLHTPMYWFDVTPTGRIISRCTKDQDDLDSNLPFSIQNTIVTILIMLSALGLICIILPLFIPFAAITMIIFYKIVKYYLITVVELKRIEANLKTPLISTIQESINGTYIIRSFDKSGFYLQRYLKHQHGFIVTLVNYGHSQRWIGIMTELVAVFIIVITCYFSVLSKQFNYIDNTSAMGLCITWAFQISMVMGFALKMIADCEAQMNSLVRMLQYIENNPQEKSWKEPKPSVKELEWPNDGKIEINNITYKYRPELPEVIKGISFDIESKEKIGIVGRTGSGKSTLTLGLLRILELSQSQSGNLGTIKLDGQDISQIGLHVLREKCTIIPQDPLLFTGTIRYNIDPFNKYSDQEVITALKQVQIWDQLKDIEKLKQDKQKEEEQNDQKQKQQININITEQALQPQSDEDYLKTTVDDGGDNFSLGQRQLICMARALIRKPKVLLMDEATASIDEMTDHLIQKMIKVAFKETTVITIAHRINTIMQYDKILVLEQGNIVQYDSPLNLLKQQTGIFSSLVKEGGKQFEEKMLYLAQNKDQIIE